MPLEQRLLAPSAGVSTGIGFYLSAMEEVREELRKTVRDLSDEQIARHAFEGAHSIAALVLHVGEAEWWWMRCFIAGHKLTARDRQKPYWDVLVDTSKLAGKNYSAQFCLQTIDRIRAQTHKALTALSDADLERRYRMEKGGETFEANLRWVLHHLADHEAQHKGQIAMLKRLLKENRTP
jgi:uncharacterized damage-inducible protein DinB